jgi:hypothetical protein
LLPTVVHAIRSGRSGGCGKDGLAIAEYRVICVVRRADGHLRAVGYNANGNDVMYDDLWSVAQARQAIEAGHGEEIRTRPGEDADHSLEDLPPCG